MAFCLPRSPLFELASVLVRLNHVARFIVNASKRHTRMGNSRTKVTPSLFLRARRQIELRFVHVLFGFYTRFRLKVLVEISLIGFAWAFGSSHERAD